MRLTHCKKCLTPVIRWDDVGLERQADITPLEPVDLAHAWLEGQRTYIVRTLHRLQWANPYPASRFNRHLLADQLRQGQPSRATVLVAHRCSTGVVDVDQALDRWQVRDRAALVPVPRPAPVLEGMLF